MNHHPGAGLLDGPSLASTKNAITANLLKHLKYWLEGLTNLEAGGRGKIQGDEVDDLEMPCENRRIAGPSELIKRFRWRTGSRDSRNGS